MTAPDPPVEAVGAALADDWVSRVLSDYDAEGIARTMLAAALPHLEAQFLAKVDAALRDDDAFREWWFGSGRILLSTAYRSTLDGAADYLRDTFTPDAEEAT